MAGRDKARAEEITRYKQYDYRAVSSFAKTHTHTHTRISDCYASKLENNELFAFLIIMDFKRQLCYYSALIPSLGVTCFSLTVPFFYFAELQSCFNSRTAHCCWEGTGWVGAVALGQNGWPDGGQSGACSTRGRRSAEIVQQTRQWRRSRAQCIKEA